MNILIITEFFPVKKDLITGGVENRAFNIARKLSKKHKIFILTSRRKNQKQEELINGIKIIRVGREYEFTHNKHLFKRFSFILSSIKKIDNIIEKNKIDIIDGFSFFAYPSVVFSNSKCKKFLTYHEVWIGRWLKNTHSLFGIFGEILERIILTKARKKNINFIAVSNFTKKQLIKQGINQKRINTIYNGINIKNFSNNIKKYKNPTICTISRLTKNKRVDYLIKATSKIKEEYPNIKLKIIGKGDEEKNLKKLTKKLNLEKNVDFVGFLDNRKKLKTILKKTHVFSSASIVEGFGIVLLEAMASQVPYVVTNIGPFREVTQNGKGGILFKKKDILDLANNIKSLIKNKENYKIKQKEERELIKEYDWDILIKRLLRVYKK